MIGRPKTESHSSGYENTGSYNTGSYNTGDWNTGHRNTGHCNTFDYNTGNRNTGNCNTGNYNTGDYNSGHYNTGDWNTGDWNTGYCNSVRPAEILVFNKPCSLEKWNRAEKPDWMYVSLTNWVGKDRMTDKEKETHPSYVTTGGYLKCYPSLKAAYVEAWEQASDEDRALTEKLPNFDPHVFAEVFGFDPFKSDEPRSTCEGRIVEIDGKRYRLVEE